MDMHVSFLVQLADLYYAKKNLSCSHSLLFSIHIFLRQNLFVRDVVKMTFIHFSATTLQANALQMWKRGFLYSLETAMSLVKE